MFRFNAQVKEKSFFADRFQHAFEIHPRTKRIRLLVHIKVARKPRGAELPGDGCVSIQDNAPHHVVRLRTLAHAPDGSAGETHALVGEHVQCPHRRHFYLGGTVDVYELPEDEAYIILITM